MLKEENKRAIRNLLGNVNFKELIKYLEKELEEGKELLVNSDSPETRGKCQFLRNFLEEIGKILNK
jgi:hypothetical protein